MKILLINPPVYDFKLYNEWMNPTGLMQVSSYLKHCGFETEIFDSLYSISSIKKFATGFFTREPADFPLPDSSVLKQYFRYGMPKVEIESLLSNKKFDAVIVGSFLTYWYPGCFEIIKTVKKINPKAPVFLGGIYATLCYEHAKKYSEADFVIPGNFNEKVSLEIAEILHFKNYKKPSKDKFPPDISAVEGKPYISLSLSTGCPYRCSFCASSLLSPVSGENIFPDTEFFIRAYQNGIRDFAFFDDALLYYFDYLKEKILILQESKVFFRYHAPNGLHINRINAESAQFLFESGFKTLRFGLESFDESIQKKANINTVITGINHLKKAGFTKKEIGFYVLLLPDIHVNKTEETIKLLKSLGVNIHINVYSPVPGTPDYIRLAKMHPEIVTEPLYHNDSLFYRKYGIFPENWLRELKEEIRGYNSLE